MSAMATPLAAAAFISASGRTAAKLAPAFEGSVASAVATISSLNGCEG